MPFKTGFIAFRVDPVFLFILCYPVVHLVQAIRLWEAPSGAMRDLLEKPERGSLSP